MEWLYILMPIAGVKIFWPGLIILGVGVGENFFASDVTALVSHTKNVIYLEDGEFAEITPDSISIYDSTGATVHRSISRIVWDIEAAEKGGYEHFMLKEIMEQPRALKATIAPRIKNGKIVLDDFDEAFRADFRYINRIVITACGSDRPPRCNSSSTSSKDAESEPPGVQIGKIRSRSPGILSEASSASRARIQFRLPLTVLISPLWAISR